MRRMARATGAWRTPLTRLSAVNVKCKDQDLHGGAGEASARGAGPRGRQAAEAGNAGGDPKGARQAGAAPSQKAKHRAGPRQANHKPEGQGRRAGRRQADGEAGAGQRHQWLRPRVEGTISHTGENPTDPRVQEQLLSRYRAVWGETSPTR